MCFELNFSKNFKVAGKKACYLIMSSLVTFLLQVAITIHSIITTLALQPDSSEMECDVESGWKHDYEPEFSHRNGDHSFCDLEIISLDKLSAYINISSPHNSINNNIQLIITYSAWMNFTINAT